MDGWMKTLLHFLLARAYRRGKVRIKLVVSHLGERSRNLGCNSMT